MCMAKSIDEAVGKFSAFLLNQWEYEGPQEDNKENILGHQYDCPFCKASPVTNNFVLTIEDALKHHQKCQESLHFNSKKYEDFFKHYLMLDHSSDRKLTQEETDALKPLYENMPVSEINRLPSAEEVAEMFRRRREAEKAQE